MEKVIVKNPGFKIVRAGGHDHLNLPYRFSAHLVWGLKGSCSLAVFLTNKDREEEIMWEMMDKDPKKLAYFMIDVLKGVEKGILEGKAINLQFKKK